MGKIAEVQEVAIDQLIPYVNNAKIHSDEQVTRIASSIREYGVRSEVCGRDHPQVGRAHRAEGTVG